MKKTIMIIPKSNLWLTSFTNNTKMLHVLYLRFFRIKSCACSLVSEQTSDSGLNKTTMLQYISDKDSLFSISLTLFQMNEVM